MQQRAGAHGAVGERDEHGADPEHGSWPRPCLGQRAKEGQRHEHRPDSEPHESQSAGDHCTRRQPDDDPVTDEHGSTDQPGDRSQCAESGCGRVEHGRAHRGRRRRTADHQVARALVAQWLAAHTGTVECREQGHPVGTREATGILGGVLQARQEWGFR